MEKVIVLISSILIPFIVHRYGTKVKIIEWLSPVVCCYALGILLGNILKGFWDSEFARLISEASVMLALPILLLSTDFMGWLKLAKETIISFVLVIICVMACAYLCGSVFIEKSPEVWKLAGMLTGVYIGGTPNLMSIGRALEVSNEAFIMLNAAEMAIGGIYLLFIMSIGVKVLTKFLPPFDHEKFPEDDTDLIHWRELTHTRRAIHAIILVVVGLVLAAISVGFSKLVTGGESVSLIIMTTTLLSIGLSFIQKVRHFEGSQEVGNFLLLVFCVAIGSLADVSQLLSGAPWYFVLCASILLSSISLHFLCCYFLKIDRDTAIITSIAGIFGPAFVAPMSGVLKNKAILFSGVTTGLVGYAVGNFAGYIVAHLLKR